MSTDSTIQPVAADIIGVIESLAPPILAEHWDNCGLQVGSRTWPVKKVWIALDPLLEVVREAAGQEVDLLVTHHPLLFNPLRSIDVETPVGKIVETALTARMAIYSAHTNLDSASEGLNHIFAGVIGLHDLVPMVPCDAEESGRQGGAPAGMGRIGRLDQPLSLAELAHRIRIRFNLPGVKIVGEPESMVDRVAVCSGSGSSLLDAFLNSDAQVYLTGDLRYHDARRVEDDGRAMIDVGHFASEHIFIDPLVAHLRQAARHAGWSVDIDPCRIERDPFKWIE
jgi:dinuclear metal center YbgI/SA1388 family protein